MEADDDEQDPMIGPLSWHIPLRISSGPPPLFATDPRSHLPLAGSLGQEGVPSRAQQPASQRVQGPTERQGPPGLHAGQERVALPVLQLQTEAAHRADAVAASESARAAAEAAAARACAASSGGGAAASALLKDALRWVDLKIHVRSVGRNDAPTHMSLRPNTSTRRAQEVEVVARSSSS